MLWLLGAWLAAIGTHAATPPVKVSLRTSWAAPPFLLEIIETVALENPNAFFPYLDRVTDPELVTFASNESPEAIYSSSLEVATSHGFLSDPGALAAVEMNLALHAATPKIEAFYHHYAESFKDERERSEDCGSWVDWYGTVVCDVESLAQLAGLETIDSGSSNSSAYKRPKLLPFDHIYSPPSLRLTTPHRTAILYASLASNNFRELHTYLLDLAGGPNARVEYVLRHIPPKISDVSRRSFLSGYSVALDLKKMDYLALDDRHVNSNGGHADTSTEATESSILDPILSLLDAYPENVTAPDTNKPPTEEELLVIGFQASQLIVDSPDPLLTLTHLSQNFPKYVTSLARRVVVNDSLAEEIHNNQLMAQAGVNAIWLNGVNVQEKDANVFGLLRQLKKERRIMLELTALGLERAEAIELLTHQTIATAQNDGKGVLDGLFDASDRSEGGGVIIWWNDMEKDSRYAQWSPSINSLLRPLYPGQFPMIKLNLFNIVLALDLSHTSSVNYLAGIISNIIQRGFPFRFGVVPLVETEDGAKMARLFYYLLRSHGRKQTMTFLKQISQTSIPANAQTEYIQWSVVRAEFGTLMSSLSSAGEPEEKTTVDLDGILDGTNELVPKLDNMNAYCERLGASLASSPGGHAFVNGKHFDMDDMFLRRMQMEIGQQVQHLQEQIYEGKLTDAQNEMMSTYFFDLPMTSKRRNTYIVPTKDNLRILSLPEVFVRSGFHASPSMFVYPDSAESDVIPITMYIVADINSNDGLLFVKEALLSMEQHSTARLFFVHNPPIESALAEAATSSIFAHLKLTHRLSKVAAPKLVHAPGLTDPNAVNDSSGAQTVLSQADTLTDILGGVKLSELDLSNHTTYLDVCRRFVRDTGINPGQNGIVINGRVVGPIASGEFRAADFLGLQQYEMLHRIQPVLSALEDIRPSLKELDRASLSHLLSMASSVISAIQVPDPSEAGLFDTPQRSRNRNYQKLESNYTAFELGNNTTALYHIAILLDPLSEGAQKWSGLVQWLLHVPDVFIEVHLNPAQHGEVPLKKFFRYNLRPALTFDEAGEEISSETVFEGLPVDPIYTLGMDVPSSWLVRPREALYDLDNIQLGNLAPEDTSVDAVFDLDYLVVEGHARDTVTNSPPRGVQLELVSGPSHIDDTLVVANLGYFQFKAKPGVFQLEIREGRGRDIFSMESVGNEGWFSPSVAEVGNEITVTSFEGLTLYPRLVRLPGMETQDVLAEEEEEEESSGLLDTVFSSFKSLFGPKETTDLVVVNEQADINIFTVASGLLYERFASIMILSVLRNTNSTVKFWFIENFLSPSFLEFIPHLAEAYNFKYELVTYKWPSWLRAQKEKQRIIWAYKILFLDVLFPMDLKKVIFVDADQIVRADLQELVDLDLHGAPYGYTPMGDDNTDMEGFRFWKTGYWKDFLQGRPYHISALYVVDLVRFRQVAAGDILRGSYQQLSMDPNSLANLDQDLPNNLQREVPIFSLNEDWLWCETWCSKDRLHRAKTIDLCQNPLTKEPKLSRARQIPEWEEYDAEISRFTRKLGQEGKIRSRIATADTNVLANAGSSSSSTPRSSESNEETADSEESHKEFSEGVEETPRDEL